jgi:hypothetical protein
MLKSFAYLLSLATLFLLEGCFDRLTEQEKMAFKPNVHKLILSATSKCILLALIVSN